MKNLLRPIIIDGGIKYPNPTIYCKLFFNSNLFNYIKIFEKNLPFNSETYFIEYEVGLVLSRMYDLQKLNNLSHRDHLTPYYEQTIQILTENKMSLEELQNEKIKDIYRRLILSDYHAWSQWMDNVLKPARFNVSPTAPIAAKLWQYWLTIFKNFLETIQQDDLNKPTVLISFVSADVYEIFLRRCQL